MKDLDLPWVVDPKTSEPSVSLSMLVLSFLGVIVAAGLHMADVVKDTSVMAELFYGNLALYFGRRLSVGTKNFSSETSSVDQPK